MIIVTFGILQLAICWRIIRLPGRPVKFTKTIVPSAIDGFSARYLADRSRHEVPTKPARQKLL